VRKTGKKHKVKKSKGGDKQGDVVDSEDDPPVSKGTKVGQAAPGLPTIQKPHQTPNVPDLKLAAALVAEEGEDKADEADTGAVHGVLAWCGQG